MEFESSEGISLDEKFVYICINCNAILITSKNIEDIWGK